MMIGLPAMVYPSGSNVERGRTRLPSWKIQTSAPKLAVIDSRVMITALIGMTIEPNSRNRITALAMSVTADRIGRALALRHEEVVAGGGAPADLGRDAVRRHRSPG